MPSLPVTIPDNDTIYHDTTIRPFIMSNSPKGNEGDSVIKVLQRRSRRNFSARMRGVADFGAGKDGTMSAEQAEEKFVALCSLIQTEQGVDVGDINDETVAGFRVALYAYLALNTGSVNAEDGFSASADSATFISFSNYRVEAVKVRADLGSTTYRFMRAKADDICEVVLELYRRASLPLAEEEYPMACEFKRNMDVVAAKRGMLEYPQYTFVGAEYVTNLSPRIRRVILEAASLVLGNRTHTREDAREGIMRAAAGIYN